ncbi:MAG: HAD family hydrolase [Velocimicrobium sp.]
MNKKVVFLDIDGTLIGFDGTLPDSTRAAIRRARKNGHHMVLCSGRSRFQMYPSLLALGFQGIVGAAGAFVECEGEEIYHHYMEEEKRKWITAYLESNQFVYSMQADSGMVINERCKHIMLGIYKAYGMDEKRLRRLVGNMEVREDVWNQPREEKIIYYKSPFPLEMVKKDIAPYFEAVASSLEEPDAFSGEIGPANINKATGMQIYLNHVGVGQEDTIAIGDGPNDLEMIQYAKVGVAMGNAQQVIKKAANLVTKRVDENGIYHAFEQLGLL